MSEEMKICKKCGKEKNIEKFGNVRAKDGKQYKRNVCKVCHNKQTSESKQKKRDIPNENVKPKNYTVKQNKSVKTQNTSLKTQSKKENDYNMFDKTEIETLKNMIKNYNTNKIVFDTIEDIKDKKCISISRELNKRINEISKKTKLNYSQTLESIIKKGLEYI